MPETIYIAAKQSLKIADLREKFGMSGPLRAYHTQKKRIPRTEQQ